MKLRLELPEHDWQALSACAEAASLSIGTYARNVLAEHAGQETARLAARAAELSLSAEALKWKQSLEWSRTHRAEWSKYKGRIAPGSDPDVRAEVFAFIESVQMFDKFPET